MSSISGEEISWVSSQVCLKETVVIAENGSGDSGPGTFQAQRSVDVVALDFVPLKEEYFFLGVQCFPFKVVQNSELGYLQRFQLKLIKYLHICVFNIQFLNHQISITHNLTNLNFSSIKVMVYFNIKQEFGLSKAQQTET